MAVGSTINQVVQFGREATPGTPATIVERLLGLSVEINPEVDIQELEARGIKFPVGHVPTREWATADGEGGFSFNEMPFVFDGAMRKPTSQNIMTGGATPTVAARRLLYDINDVGKDSVQTYTLQQGDRERTGQNARESAYMHIPGFNVGSERTGELEVGFDMVGRLLVPDTLVTAGITERRTVYATPEMVNVYVDDTAANIGTTLMRNSTVEFDLSDRFNQAWFHDRSLASFLEHVETRASLELTLTIGEGPDLDDFMQDLRNQIRKFVEMNVLGPLITNDPANTRYEFQWRTACQISDSWTPDDDDGVYLAELTMAAERDPVWGKTTELELICLPTAP